MGAELFLSCAVVSLLFFSLFCTGKDQTIECLELYYFSQQLIFGLF